MKDGPCANCPEVFECELAVTGSVIAPPPAVHQDILIVVGASGGAVGIALGFTSI